MNQLSSDLGGLSFGKTTEGEWGYKPEGADSVIPFRNEPIRQSVSVYGYSSTDGTMYSPEAYRFTAPKAGKASFYVTFGSSTGQQYGCHVKINNQEWMKIISFPEGQVYAYGGWSDPIEVSADDVISIGILSPNGIYSHLYSAAMIIE